MCGPGEFVVEFGWGVVDVEASRRDWKDGKVW